MTSRGRKLFWGLTLTLTLLMLTAAGVVGRRAWQVEDARRSLVSRDVEVFFLYSGPKWLELILPKVITNAWFSSTYIIISSRSESLPRFSDADWEAVLPDIKQLPDVGVLDFWRVGIDAKTLNSLADFPMLFRLTIVDSQLIDEDLACLGRCTQLYSLNVSQNEITGEGLVHLYGLKNLHELTLDKTQITEDGLVHLRQFTHLTNLSITNTGIPESALMSLEADIPGLMISDD